MEEKFSFTILTKTSSYIGLGHFNRCKILAEELIKRGNKVVLYVYGKKFTNDKKSRHGLWGVAFPGIKYISKYFECKLAANYNSSIYFNLDSSNKLLKCSFMFFQNI